MKATSKLLLGVLLGLTIGCLIGATVVYTAMSGLGSPGHLVQGMIDDGQISFGGSSAVLSGMKTRDDAQWQRGSSTYEVRAYTDRPRVIILYIKDGSFIGAQAIGDGDDMWMFAGKAQMQEMISAIAPDGR